MKAKQCLVIVFLIAVILIGGCQDSQEPVEDSPIHKAAMLGELYEIESLLAAKPRTDKF